MADRLTQLQDAVDQMGEQFWLALQYIAEHHDFAPLGSEQKKVVDNLPIDDPKTFRDIQAELSRDLIAKARQIDLLIDNLPGVGVSQDDQREAVVTLNTRLKEAQAERKNAIKEKDEVLERLERVICSLKRQ